MGSIFKAPKAPPPPKPVDMPEPTPMPIMDETGIARSRRKAVAAASMRGGRASTILTDTNGGTLG